MVWSECGEEVDYTWSFSESGTRHRKIWSLLYIAQCHECFVHTIDNEFIQDPTYWNINNWESPLYTLLVYASSVFSIPFHVWFTDVAETWSLHFLLKWNISYHLKMWLSINKEQIKLFLWSSHRDQEGIIIIFHCCCCCWVIKLNDHTLNAHYQWSKPPLNIIRVVYKRACYGCMWWHAQAVEWKYQYSPLP